MSQNFSQLVVRDCVRGVTGFIALLCAFLCTASSPLAGQTPTVVTIGNNFQQSSVKRLGINLGTQGFWGSGQIMKNLSFRNPGFEGESWQSILHCAAVTSNSCTDNNIYAVWPNGFFNGATAEFIYGANTGNTTTVTTTTAASYSGNVGTTVTFASVPKPLAVGDYVIVRMTVPGNGQDGWWTSSANGATISTETTDLSPNTPGLQALYVNASGANQQAAVNSYFDSISNNTSYLQLNGTYTVTFRAKGVGGKNQLNLSVTRLTTPPSSAYLNQVVNLSNTWQDYSYSFTAAESGAVGTISLSLGAAGSSFYLDDVSISKTSGSPSNPTAYRDEVVATLESLQPGILRYMDSGLNWGSSLDNMLAVQFARNRPGYSPSATESDQVPMGLHDFLVLCQTVGAEPWYTIQTGWSVQEMQNLMDYLGGSTATVYGAKRAALGQTAPWTSVFPVIHLEFGNEVWNNANGGTLITDPVAYGTRAAAMFGAAKASASYTPSKFDMIVDGWSAVPYFNQNVLANSANYDTIDIAPYLFSTFNDSSSNEAIFGPMFAEPESWDSIPGGQVVLQAQTAAGAKVPAKLAVYEVNLSTNSGSVSQASINAAVPSVGSGLAAIEHMLLMLRDDGIINQNFYSLTGYTNSFYNPNISGENTPLWGSVIDMGNTNRKRPDFYALQLANSAILPYLLQTTLSGANPTWNQALSTNDNISLAGAHDIQSFAFTNGTTNNLVLFNLNRSQALPVSFAGVNAPVGNVTVQTLTSTNITDGNETSSVVSPKTSTETITAGQSVTLPPFSMTVLTSAAPAGVGTPTAAPTITGVSVTCSAGTLYPSGTASCTPVVAGTGAFSTGVTWTASAGTISSSGAYTAPTTVPSGGKVTITAASTQSPSISATFTIIVVAAGTPTFSNVITNVSPTTAIISWQTNTPTNNGISYGPTSTLGQNTPWVGTSTATPSFTLTGLTPGTKYYLQLVSVSSSATGYYPLTITTPATSSAVSSIAVACAPSSLVVSAASACVATVSGTGAYSSAVTWTASAGTITSAGIYTAPATPPPSGSVTITATSTQNAAVTGTAMVAVTASGSAGTTLAIASVTPSCAPSSILTSAASTCAATVTGTGSYSSAVTWAANVGTISSTGVYTAPATVPASGSATITATSTQDPTKSGSTTVTITAPAPTISSVSVICSPTSVVTGATSTCTPTVTGTGAFSSAVTWTVSAGTISATGVFTAPATVPASGSVTITATSTQNSTKLGSASVTVTAPPPAISSIAVACSPASVTTGSTVSCAATVAGTGSYSSGVTWTASAGTITSTGAYTAPATVPAAGYAIVTATSTQDATKSGSANVTVTAPAPTAPILTNITTTNLTSTSVTISWQTNQPTYNGVSYGTTPSYGQNTATPSTTSETPSINLTGLTPGTVYYLQLWSIGPGATGYSTFSITTPAVTSVSVGCSPTSLALNATSSCTATVAGIGTFSSGVTWSASAGTITSTGAYTAPATMPTSGAVTITATSTQNTAKTGSASITINPPAPTITSVGATCSPSSVVAGATSTCAASVAGTGAYSSAVTWTASAGTISSTGVYTAPATPPTSGSATITATSTQDATKSGIATVTVTPAPPTITSVSVVCAPTSVLTGATSTCSATVAGTGSYSSAVTWTASAGTISASGVFTAPTTVPTSGSVTITATSTQNSAKAGTATVAITAVPPTITSVAIACSPTSVLTGATSTCSATVAGTGSYSSAVTWAASAGTISAAGVFTAPATVPASGSVTITATSTQNTAKTATTTVGIAVPGTTAISAVTTSATSNSIVVSWQTNVPTYSGINYGPSPTLGQNTPWVGTPTTTPTFTLTGLSPGTEYYLQLASIGSSTTAFYMLTITTPTAASSVSSVGVTCSPNSVTAGAPATCSASVAGTGGYSSAVTWSASAGTISPTGAFTAPASVPTSGSVTITATSSQNPAVSGSATIAITATQVLASVTSVAVSCSPVSITTGATASCAANVSGTGSYSSAVTWTASTGTISPAGVFTAPTTVPTSGSVTITATSAVSPTKSGSASVAIAAPGTPSISAVTTSTTSTSVTVSWQTNTPSYNGINYGLTDYLGQGTPWNGTPSTTPSFTITGLTPGTKYYLQLASIGSSGTGYYSFTITTP